MKVGLDFDSVPTHRFQFQDPKMSGLVFELGLMTQTRARSQKYESDGSRCWGRRV